jgi:hypothetical protein
MCLTFDGSLSSTAAENWTVHHCVSKAHSQNVEALQFTSSPDSTPIPRKVTMIKAHTTNGN